MVAKYPNVANIDIGQEIALLHKKPDRVQIARFAGATGDYNPIHIDEEFGKQAGFGGTIAHGLLIMGFVSQLMTDWLGNPAALKRVKVRFSGTVKPADDLTIRGILTKKEREGDSYRVTCEVSVENQRAEKVQTGIAEALIPAS